MEERTYTSADLDALDEALTAEDILREVIGDWLIRENMAGTQPLVAAASLLGVLYDVLTHPVAGMGTPVVRAALLMVYERSYDEPMTFLERIDAGKLLDQLVNARRKVEGRPSLILPGEQ